MYQCLKSYKIRSEFKVWRQINGKIKYDILSQILWMGPVATVSSRPVLIAAWTSNNVNVIIVLAKEKIQAQIIEPKQTRRNRTTVL